MATVTGSSTAAAEAAARQEAIRRAEEARRQAEEARRRAEAARQRAQKAAQEAKAQQQRATQARKTAANARKELDSLKRTLKVGGDRLNPNQQTALRTSIARGERDGHRLSDEADAQQQRAHKAAASAAELQARAAKVEGSSVREAKAATADANRAASQALGQAQKTQAAALEAAQRADNTRQALASDALPGSARASLESRYQTQRAQADALARRATALTARAATLQGDAVAAGDATLSLERQVNASSRAQGKALPYAAADTVRDTYDAGSLSASAQRELLGAPAAVTPQQAASRDALRIAQATKTSPLNGSQMLADQLGQSDDPAYRLSLVQAARPSIEQIGAAATGDQKPDANDMQRLADNLSRAGELSGRDGSALIAATLAPRLGDNELGYDDTRDGKPVFNSENLDGALANSALAGNGATLFRSIPAQLEDLGKASSSNWEVHKSESGLTGVVNSVTGFVGGVASDVFTGLKDGAVNTFNAFKNDPLKAASEVALGGPAGVADLATGGHVGALAEKGAKWAGDRLGDAERAIVFGALTPVTGPVNDAIRSLKPGESYSVNVSASAEIEVGIKGDAHLSIARSEDGRGYTVSAGADLAGGVDFGLGDGMVGGGGRVEFHLDNVRDAQRAADTFARIGATAAVPGLNAAVGVAELSGGDLGFLKDHLSAVELKGQAAVDAKANLGLESNGAGLEALGLEGSAGAKASAGLRVELQGGEPSAVVFGEQVSGSLAGAAAGTEGSVQAAVTAEQRLTFARPLSLGDLVKPGNLVSDITKGRLDASVSVDLQGQGTFGVNVDGAKTGEGGGFEASAGLNGNPATILRDVLPGALSGNFSQALRRARGDLGVSYEVRPHTTHQGGFTVGVDVLGVGGSFGVQTRTDRAGDIIAAYQNSRAAPPSDRGGNQAFEAFLKSA